MAKMIDKRHNNPHKYNTWNTFINLMTDIKTKKTMRNECDDRQAQRFAIPYGIACLAYRLGRITWAIRLRYASPKSAYADFA